MGSFKGKLFNPGLSAAVQEIQSNDFGMERAYSETYQVLQHATLDIIKLIPNSFMDFLRKNMDSTWSGFFKGAHGDGSIEEHQSLALSRVS